MTAAVATFDDEARKRVIRWFLGGGDVPSDFEIASRLRELIDDWVDYRRLGMDALASSAMDDIGAIVKALEI